MLVCSLGRMHSPLGIPTRSRSSPRYSPLVAILDGRQFFRVSWAFCAKLVTTKLPIQLHSQSAAPAASF
jgi:hypothetical protein